MIDARNIKCVVFDGDGVIFDTFATHWQFKLELLRRDSVDIETEEEFRRIWGKSGREVNEFIFARSPLGESERRRIAEKWRRKERRGGIIAAPLAERALARLKTLGLKIGLCTNRAASAHLVAAIAKSEFNLNLFDFVSTYIDPEGSGMERLQFRCGLLKLHDCHFAVPHPKPDPRSFAEIEKWLARNGVAKSEVLYVGDSLVDFKLAAAVGVKFIGVLTGAVNTPERWRKWCGLEYPDLVTSVGDLPDRLKFF